MEESFNFFCYLLLENQDIMGTVVSQNTNSTIEFKMPIKTFGNIMGYNYLGIEKEGSSYFMYIKTKANLFTKINGKRTLVLKNMDRHYYKEIMDDIIMNQAMNPKYLKIATGQRF